MTTCLVARGNKSNTDTDESLRKDETMDYTKLGNTGIEISKICVGCMSFGKAGTMHNWTLDEEQTENVVKHALDLGINFFDTANGYPVGTSEEYLGRALKKNAPRDKVVIASKVYFNPDRHGIPIRSVPTLTG